MFLFRLLKARRKDPHIKSELLRLSTQEQEKVLGVEHPETLKTKYQLAITLCQQQKYHEAESLLRRLVRQQEESLGPKDVRTLDSKHWLAIALNEQQRYTEAELLLRHLLQQREEVQGARHGDTVREKLLWHQAQSAIDAHLDYFRNVYQVASMMHKGKKYADAERLFNQLFHHEEKVFGAEHADTRRDGYILQKLKTTIAASSSSRPSRESIEPGWPDETPQEEAKVAGKARVTEEVIGPIGRFGDPSHKHRKGPSESTGVNEHKDATGSSPDIFTDGETQSVKEPKSRDKFSNQERRPSKTRSERPSDVSGKKANRLSKDEVYEQRSSIEVDRGCLTEQVGLSRLADFFDDQWKKGAFTDSEIQYISRLVADFNPLWSKVPRTYIVLRTIGCLDLLNTFVEQGFSDYWFPVSEKNLPSCLSPTSRIQFVATQSLVITKSVGLEKGKKGQHCYFQSHEPLPFEEKGTLGSGSSGQVDRVLSLLSFREYARKRVPRSVIFRGWRKKDIEDFIEEIQVLKRLQHRHVVEFVGSYTDAKYMGLIMNPIADMDLSDFLLRAETADFGLLRTFFGCLTRALEFLHSQKIRHKDIKPKNILVHGDIVLLADFGLSRDFKDADSSTTVGQINGMTPRYCAPEVAYHEPRNTSADIWSLGVVFLEMAAALKGRTADHAHGFLLKHGSQRAFVHSNLEGLNALIAELRSNAERSDNVVLDWTCSMLRPNSGLRPTAAELVTSIIAAGRDKGRPESFCGQCCISQDEAAYEGEDLE